MPPFKIAPCSRTVCVWVFHIRYLDFYWVMKSDDLQRTGMLLCHLLQVCWHLIIWSFCTLTGCEICLCLSFELGSGDHVCLCLSLSDFKTGVYFASMCVCVLSGFSSFFLFFFPPLFDLTYELLQPWEMEEKFLHQVERWKSPSWMLFFEESKQTSILWQTRFSHLSQVRREGLGGRGGFVTPHLWPKPLLWSRKEIGEGKNIQVFYYV